MGCRFPSPTGCRPLATSYGPSPDGITAPENSFAHHLSKPGFMPFQASGIRDIEDNEEAGVVAVEKTITEQIIASLGDVKC